MNDAPTTDNVSASGNEDAASIAVTLTGSDIDGTVASFSLSSLPANGTLYTDSGLTTLATTGTDYAASGGSLTLYFVPDANYNGSTNFAFAAKDNSGTADPSPATATITVNAVNDAPTTDNVSASGNEDAASIAVTLTGSDIDGTVASFSLSSLPANGTLYTNAGLTTLAATGTDYAASGGSLTLYFVPNANYNGSTNFTFAAKDNSGTADPSPATATITVNAVNDAPTTDNVSASGNEDAASIAVTLTGSDIDGTVASFSLSSLPANGTLYTDSGLTTLAATGTDYAASGGSLTLYFVPNANYNGSTNFSFAAKDNSGTADPSPATATITVNAVNDAPTTDNVSASGNEDAASIAVTLTGSDIDGTVASYSLSSLPANGTLYTNAGLTTLATTGTDYAASGGSLTLYFVPNANYNGSTNFAFAAKDNSGTTDPSPATATITVNAVNDAPTTDNVSASGNEDAASIAVTLTGSDIDGTVASFSLSSLPANGTLYTDSGLTTLAATGTDYAASGGSLTLYFVPDANYNGSTNFSFAAKDNSGTADPSPATATITVNAVNDAPTTDNVSASGNEDAASIAVTLTGSDIDGTVASFSLSSLPANGTLYTDSGLTTLAATGTDYAASGDSLTLYFVPNANYNGSTNFSFAAKDNSGTADPSPATATITVNAVNDDPDGTDSVASMESGTAISGTLTASDVDNTAGQLSYSLATGASNGVAVVNADGTYTYTPNAGYVGSDSFTFTVTDPGLGSDTATVNVTVLSSGGSLNLSTGSEARVNSTTSNKQQDPAVANLSGGGYVVVWQHGADSEEEAGNVYAQRYDSSGNTVGSQITVGSYGGHDDNGVLFEADVTGLTGGGFVVTWQEDEEVLARIYDSSGNPSGSEFTVNTTTGNTQESPAIAATGDGGFVVVWDGNGSGDSSGVFGQRYNSSGSSVGSEFRVNTTTSNTQDDPNVAALNNGGFVVVWDGNGTGDSSGVFAQLYNSSGNTVGSEFRVNTTTSDTQSNASVTTLNNGDFLVVWQSDEQDGDDWGIYAQRFDSSGSTVGSEFRVNTTTSNDQTEPEVTALNDGGFMVVWESANQDGSQDGVYAKRYDADGSDLSGEIRVNTTTSNNQGSPDIDVLQDGSVIVTWDGNGPGDSNGIHSHLYSTDAPSGHTMTGGAGNDSFIGGSAGDTLTGAGGNDLLDGGGGADSLNGGAGDDILIWDSADTTIAGGTGADTLRVSSGNADLTAFGGTITGIETVDLATDTGANSLVLTAQDVLDISDTDVVTVDGTGADSVNAGTGWTDGGVSGGYHTYTKVIGADLATLLVDTDISVNADILT